MNKLKKLMSALLVTVMLFSVTSCAKSTDEAKTTTSENSVESTTTTTKAITLSRVDKISLIETLSYVIGHGGRFEKFELSYDSSSPQALKDATRLMTSLFYTTIYEWFSIVEIYGFNENQGETYSSQENADPLNKIDKNLYYEKIDEKIFDNILINVFDVKPNHSFVYEGFYDSEEDEDKQVVYNYDGYYYISRMEGGDGAGPKAFIDKIEIRPDGKCVAKVTIKWVSFDDYEGDIYTKTRDEVGGEHLGEFSVICQINEVDDINYWKIYKIETIN